MRRTSFVPSVPRERRGNRCGPGDISPVVSGRWSQLAAGAVVALLAGCSADPVQCGPCPQPGTVHVSGVSGTATALRVCVGHDPCVLVDLSRRLDDDETLVSCETAPGLQDASCSTYRGRVELDPPLLRRAAEYDGVLVRVTATDPSGTRRARPRPLVWDDPDEVCACSSLDARLRLRPAG